MKSFYVTTTLAILFAGFAAAPTTLPSPQPTTSVWKLVWSDEFDHPGRPDPAKWGYETGYVRNHESQFYTEGRRENARIENGCLLIEARKETFPNPKGKPAAYTSAALETKDKVSWLYGRIEVRAKVPLGRGTWPAIWLMPQDGSAGWPAGGEIDVMENVGFEPNVIHQTIHTKAANHINHKAHGTTTPEKNLGDDFHVYAMEWDAHRMEMTIDGKSSFTFDNPGTGPDAWPFDKPFYVILNLAIGGEWGAAKGIDDTIFPSQFLIDYVRVYQRR